MVTHEITIRMARESDLAALHLLIESAYRGSSAKAGWTHEADLLEGPRTSVEALTQVVRDPDQRLLIFHEGAVIVGNVLLTRVSSTLSYLGLLTVDPLRQASGLGKFILAAAEREAVRHFGSEMMELSVVSQRAELIAYYERRGYDATGELRPFPIALDPPFFLRVMRKNLSAESL